MPTPKKGFEQAEVSLAPIATDMTQAEFLQNDLEGYEYVKGELVPMSPPSMEHGEISTNVIRYLDSYVYRHQLGRVYTAETTFQLGDRLVKPDIAFVSTSQKTQNEIAQLFE